MKYLKSFEAYSSDDDKLSVVNNGLTSLDSCLPFPKNLKEIYCYQNSKLKKLPELPDNLEVLSCFQCSLEKLPELPSTLTKLFCQYNNIKILPELPESLINLKCHDNNWIKPIPYKYYNKFKLIILENYTQEQIDKFSSFEFQKEFLENEPENYLDLKPFGYANGIEELFPHLFDMDELGLID